MGYNPRVIDPQVRPTSAAGPFDPVAFKAADEMPVRIDWRPGAVVSLDFGTGSIVEKTPPIIVTGVVAGLAAFLASGRWFWAFVTGIVALFARTAIEKRRVKAQHVRFDWTTQAATFSTSGFAVPFERIKELVLRGHRRHLGPRRDPDSTDHYWCELVASEGTTEHVVAVGKWFNESDSAYQMMAPMAAELAGALSVPWRFENFALPLSSLIDQL